jgi:YggT family protein
MSVVLLVLSWAVQIYIWFFIARFFIDLVRSVNPSFSPKGLLVILLEIVMTLTDPPLKLVRKFIRPFRVGSLALDFSWTVVVLLLSMVQNLITGFTL